MSVTAQTYRLAAEYWHPDVDSPWLSPQLLASAEVAPLDSYQIECAFAALLDEEDVRCWYYLLLAAEAES